MRLVPAAVMAATLGILLAGCQSQTVKTQPAGVQPAAVMTPGASAKEQTRAPAPAPVTDLWTLTRRHLQLPLDFEHPRIQTQFDWYQRHPAYLQRVSERARPYYHHILHQVLARGMPAEIALLPVVESAYDPFAYSHGRAAGPWQFIPGTARHFGLKSNWWYDGRRDILASTEAALTYLEQLHRRFDGDWLLALAAYNAGGGTVNRAIRRNREQGKPTDFWSLDLPRETEAYVPKLLAVARLVRDAEALGLTLTPIDNAPHFEVVDTGGQIDLAQAAEMAELDLDTLYRLNPGFNRWATDPDGPHRLLVPIAHAERLRSRLQALPPQQRVSWHHYRVQPGDTLITIARRFDTSVDVIRRGNRLNGPLIRVGQNLVVPKPALAGDQYRLSQPERKRARQQQLARAHAHKTYHRVAAGESFWTIARRYGVGVRELARWNQMAPGDTLRVGQQLLVLNAGSEQSGRLPELSSAPPRDMIRKVGYRIRKGDSLSSIASRFGVRVRDILGWNDLEADALLQPGQPLTLYVNVADAG